MADLFSGAKVVAPKDEPKPKASKKAEYYIGESLDMVAGIKAIQDSLEAVYETYYQDVTDKMVEKFVSDTLFHHKRPDNFKGLGAMSDASCELKKRSVKSALKPEEAKFLADNGVSLGEEVIKEAVEERFFFNEKVVMNPAIAEKVSKALSEIPELKGMDVVFKQEARPAVVATVATDASFDDIAKLSDANTIRTAYKMVATTSIRSKLVETTSSTGTRSAMEDVLSLLRKNGVNI